MQWAQLVATAMSENKGTRVLRLIDELADAAKRVGLEVRREKILREVGYRARGGACRLRDRICSFSIAIRRRPTKSKSSPKRSADAISKRFTCRRLPGASCRPVLNRRP